MDTYINKFGGRIFGFDYLVEMETAISGEVGHYKSLKTNKNVNETKVVDALIASLGIDWSQLDSEVPTACVA